MCVILIRVTCPCFGFVPVLLLCFVFEINFFFLVYSR